MAALIDQQPISTTQRVELYEEGIIWIIDDSQHKEIKLDAATSHTDSRHRVRIFALTSCGKKRNHSDSSP